MFYDDALVYDYMYSYIYRLYSIHTTIQAAIGYPCDLFISRYYISEWPLQSAEIPTRMSCLSLLRVWEETTPI